MKQFYSRASMPFLITVFSAVFVFAVPGSAQQVSGIVTDYNGYWKSSLTNLNPAKPDNSHNLLAFTYNGTQYSTGANDALLSSHGESFVAGDFWALPVEGITGSITSNTKVGWGEMKDLVHNGIGALLQPQMDINIALTDGIKGLDLGTCIANIPSGNLTFFVTNIKPENIGDGVPDILVTQIADPSGSTDRYSFVNSAGATVGSRKNIAFNDISPVGTWTADFYQSGVGGLITLLTGYTNTDRPLRLWAADLSDFGITAANYQSIVKFKVELSGNSDVAFAAYNNRTMSITTVLPVSLSNFTGKKVNDDVQLNWITASEENSDYYEIERSADNNSFTAIGKITAKGNSTSTNQYSYTDRKPMEGTSYYRLKISDKDGAVKYSPVIKIRANAATNAAYLYPNPCSNTLNIVHPSGAGAVLKLVSASGVEISRQDVSGRLQSTIDVTSFRKGVYYIVWQSASEKTSLSFVKN